PRHYTRNPNELVGVRRAYDASDAPQPVYLISAGLMGFTNGVTGAWDRSADVEFTLDQSVTPPQRVKLRARRQGALYKLDLSGGAPVLVQYDGWHEDAHFSWWQKEFAFSAPVAESTSGSADGSATLAARTEAPNLSMANLDFSNFTSFLSVSGGSATWADEAAHAPSALYRFMPRPAWPSDWSLAVRARANGGAGQVYASVDAPLGQAGTRALPVSAAGWTWICADAGGQPLTFTGLATGATHELRLAPSNSSVEIADVKLVSHAPGAGCQ
ncbi:MAG: hypothetical protein JST92_22125, partial [Deltaproteobacteria bacterium]|nr:hypothetical protein [Deltaproteobacteria bacterium]